MNRIISKMNCNLLVSDLWDGGSKSFSLSERFSPVPKSSHQRKLVKKFVFERFGTVLKTFIQDERFIRPVSLERIQKQITIYNQVYI